MDDENKTNEQENFSDDPRQNLRMENEILKLKMQAERGFLSRTDEDLPPEIEAAFLKNIQRFEEAFDKAPQITIYESIGSPAFKNIDELTPPEVKPALNSIMEELRSRNIVLEVRGQYEPSVIYKFITEQLFYEKIRELNLPGYIQSFSYEEFHPNHELDIGITAQQFLDHWFERGFDNNCLEFADQLVTPEGKIISREQVIQKLVGCLDRYRGFSNIQFRGSYTNFEWDQKERRGVGHTEAMFSFDAEIESDETIHIEGPFKLYMSNEFGAWHIVYFVFPGFAW